jgi:leucyl aminopeptidase
MDLTLDRKSPTEVEADALIVLEFEEYSSLPKGYEPMREAGEMKGKPKEFALLHHVPGYHAHRILMAGAGPKQKFRSSDLRTTVAAAVRFLKARHLVKAALVLPEDLSTPEHVSAAVEGAILGDFECDRLKSDHTEDTPLGSFHIVVDGGGDGLELGLKRGRILAESQNFTRALGNEPANLLTPTTLADRAHAMAKETGLAFEMLDEARMRELGMGSLLGVSQGSAEPPAMIVLRYEPRHPPAGKTRLGLLGKGVTFDTGGISIKPADKMDQMKFDMCGAAAVIGAMRAIALLEPPIPVIGICPAVENMLGPKAQRPGDIVTSLSGKTIEVLNTDAEGRLILADALTYAQQLGCTHLVDAATLTGAVVVALGHHHTGLFATDDALLERWKHATDHEGEKMWQLPLGPEYREQLKSGYADIANIGGRDGGAITAAMFLKEFAGETPWIHLDIAGTAWNEKSKPDMAEGATGVLVRSFVTLAANWRD